METEEEPDYASFHKSLTEELYSVKDRIRNLVSHWPTDGEHKEVALRSVLCRHLPTSVIVGRGFIVTKNKSSTQIDILVVDAAKPTLFREGDLLIVTPDAVRAVIEVKTELNNVTVVTEAIEKLTKIESMCHEFTNRDSVWTGLFSFNEEEIEHKKLLGAIAKAYDSTKRHINCVSCGKNNFVRYWPRGAVVGSKVPGPVWHSYELPHIAPSYFMGNLIDAISSVDHSSASFAWFPVIGGKEQHRKFYLPLGQSKVMPFV